MDKNPRQITRLRVNDQRILEKLVKELSISEEGVISFGTLAYEILEPVTPGESGSYVECNSAFINNTASVESQRVDAPDINISYINNGTQGHLLFTWSDSEGEKTFDLELSDEMHPLTTDNVKTFFGNQSIFGDGNIDIYDHLLTVSGKVNLSDTSATNFIFKKQSSVSIKVDSASDLSLIYKKSGTLQDTGLVDITLAGCKLIKENGTFKVITSDKTYLVTAVKDELTTI